MDMSIDEAGDDPLPSCVDSLRVAGHPYFIPRADIADASAFDNDCAVADRRIAGGRDDRGALDNRDTALTLLRAGDRRDEQTEHRKANLPRIHACLPRAGSEFLFAP